MCYQLQNPKKFSLWTSCILWVYPRNGRPCSPIKITTSIIRFSSFIHLFTSDLSSFSSNVWIPESYFKCLSRSRQVRKVLCALLCSCSVFMSHSFFHFLSVPHPVEARTEVVVRFESLENSLHDRQRNACFASLNTIQLRLHNSPFLCLYVIIETGKGRPLASHGPRIGAHMWPNAECCRVVSGCG